ncbi:hypothetical protein BGZ89_011215 [Linnemannia elongata]|nr:hypothetical protein BGZ89_011215 [Linnemannia elongata]
MFKFNFSAADLEVDEDVPQQEQDDQVNDDELSKPLSALSVSTTTTTPVVPAAQLNIHSPSCIHSLPSTLHYELAQIPVLHQGTGAGTAIATDTKTGAQKEVVTIYKRNLEDVKFQIIQEDDEFDEEKKQEKKEEGTITGPGGVEMLALAGKSDLVKGVYEGGLKTWECALDLVAYLADQKHNYDGQKVLELGCGSALPGIYVLTQSNTVQVDLQDYNDQVLKFVTLPNVLLNTHVRPDQQPQDEEEEEEEEEEKPEPKEPRAEGEEGEDDDDEEEEDAEPEKNPADGDFDNIELDLPDSDEDRLALMKKVEAQSRFFLGDWSGLVELLGFKSEDKYDLILTSETIYAEESHQKLYATIKSSLKRGGKALVAAKTFYFGVGGDILSFRRLIEQDGVFDIKVVFSAQAFVRREILELTFKA